jgi:ABC-type amino acid transport substrate-binding protein
MGDPAHAQKRAFETAVANLIATAIFGASMKVELRSQGGDRIAALDQGADLALTVETPASRERALISAPYAASSVVLVAKDGGPIRGVEDLNAKTVAVAMDELGARDIAQSYFQQRAVTVTLDNYQGVNGAATALDSDRAVAIVGDGIGVAVIAGERKLTVITALAPRPYVIATRKNAPDLAAAIDTALKDALARGAIKDAAMKAGFPYQAP